VVRFRALGHDSKIAVLTMRWGPDSADSATCWIASFRHHSVLPAVRAAGPQPWTWGRVASEYCAITTAMGVVDVALLGIANVAFEGGWEQRT